ncbi:MAG: prolipoprotein diacylglyceryl transferase, partial [Oscillospiraceae bacterium]
MINIVEFPGLGIVMEISRVAFTIFGVPIYWYGVCIGLGMLLAVLFAFSQSKSFGVDADRMVDVIVIGLVLAIVAGRLYYVAFSDLAYTNLYDIVNLRAGGIAIYGGIIGAFIGAAIGCKWRKVPLGPMFDLGGMGFLIGQAFGRWGNFFNQEAFGTNTTLPWGMLSPSTTAYLASQQAKLAAEGVMVNPALPVHPTFLYESLWCALGFLLLFLYRKKRKFNGELFLLYVMWYGF